jgi:hypothetical protein
MEEPELLVEDMRAFFRPLRSASGVDGSMRRTGVNVSTRRSN